MAQGKRFLVRHVGNMGDMVFFAPPVLEALKKRYPDCHITFVTAWGYKEKVWEPTIEKTKWGLPRVARRAKWGKRNQGGFSVALMMTNPHIDQLVHWHDTNLDLDKKTCVEEGRSFPTWNKRYYEDQKRSGQYDGVYELDFSLKISDNPLQRIYEHLGLGDETFSNYRLYFTDADRAVAAAVMKDKPRPRIMLLESLNSETTRGWDTDKVPVLEEKITETYGVSPLWFGGKFIPYHNGRPLTLRENIATLLYADVAVGVLSGPLHFAAATGVPTITLYGDQPLHRAAPAYFLNEYIRDPARRHHTLLGPTPSPMTFLKSEAPPTPLTATEHKRQEYEGWLHPGRQATKGCLAPITVEEVMHLITTLCPP
jgi:ADP-heptose:LPS heptosyltransferase